MYAGKPEGENCVLMLLDMDNFGQLNEKEGTSFANAVPSGSGRYIARLHL